MSSESPEQTIAERVRSARAVEAVVWGMPAVNFDLMYQAMVRETGGAFNQIVYWSGLPDWRNQTLTPNPDSIYVMPFFDTTEAGPVVLEIPPADDGSITGTVMDCWQAPLEDVGPAGVDEGKGGKYLILPPGHADPVPDGYIPLRSDTNTGYALLRSILRSTSDEDVAQALAYGKRVALYPLAQADAPPETVFVDAIEKVFDATIPYDRRFFAALDRVIQREPWLTRDKAMIDPIRSIGIEKDQPFAPDEPTQRLLDSAAADAHVWLDAKYEALFTKAFYEGTQWAMPTELAMIGQQQALFADPDSYMVDDRGVTYSMAFFCPKHTGVGSFYLMAIKDAEGKALQGSGRYRLTVPGDAPITQYWSATAYDRATHALIRDMRSFSVSSQSRDVAVNADGSIDVDFAPRAPEGAEASWVQTDPKGEFEVLFRFYGPERSLFEKTWALPDIQRLA